MRSPRKSVVLGLTLLSAMLATALGWFWLTYGAYGLNVVLRRAGSYWRTVGPDDPHLSPAMRTALRNPVPAASPGPLVWREVERGYEVGELPVLADGREVDRILLSRIDPAYFRFTARNAADGDRGLDEWEKALPASVLIVNGSYFGLKGSPDTPFVSNGVVLGPTRYDARAGAFVATAETATVGDDGKSHVASHSRWLANRTFVGEQPDGRIVIGTTREVFFSLDRFADFLRRSPLNLRVALNFDGGPIACQSVRLRGFTRRFYARWEAQVSGDKVRLLSWPRASAAWAMPVVLTVERRPRVKPNP
jgi:hypothetical protein